MAKSKKKRTKDDKTDKAKAPGAKLHGPDPLGEALEIFEAGDYPAARVALADKAKDERLSDVDRRRAEDLIAATRLEPGALWTALACVGFFVIAVIVGIAKQP